MDSCVPTHSRTESAPTPPVNSLTRSIPAAPRSATMSVAPKSRANSCRLLCRLITMMRSARISFAARTPISPTAPSPTTATTGIVLHSSAQRDNLVDRARRGKVASSVINVLEPWRISSVSVARLSWLSADRFAQTIVSPMTRRGGVLSSSPPLPWKMFHFGLPHCHCGRYSNELNPGEVELGPSEALAIVSPAPLRTSLKGTTRVAPRERLKTGSIPPASFSI